MFKKLMEKTIEKLEVAVTVGDFQAIDVLTRLLSVLVDENYTD